MRTMPDDIPEIVREMIYAREHWLLSDEAGQAALEVLQAGVADEFVTGLLRDRVRNHRIAQAFEGPFLLPRLSTGDVVRGLDMTGKPVLHPLQYLNGHSLTLGGSGSGKTTMSRFLVLQIASRLKGIWLFDFRKREFAVLRPHLKRVGVDLIVVPARKLRINPLQLPHAVEPADWAPRVADMLVLTLRLPERATKLIHLAVLNLYREFRCISTSRRFPTLFDLRERIAADKEANFPAKQAVVDSLDPVLLSLGPEVLAYRRGWSTRELSERHIVFELAGVSEADKDLLLNSLVLPEFTSRVAQGVSNQRMSLFICCDEAARLVSASAGSAGMVDLLGLVRGTGIGVDLSVQSAAAIAPGVLSNTANKFIGVCGSANDYEIVGSAMGLTGEQRRFLALHLRPGLFAGQLGDGDWRHPFLFRVPQLDLSRDSVTSTGPRGALLELEDSSDSRGLDDLLALPVEPASEFAAWSADKHADIFENPLESARAGAAGPILSDAEIRFLQAVVAHPGQPSSAYPKQAGIGAQQAQKARKRLVELGFLREHRVNTGGRGRASLILEPIEAATEALKAAGGTGGTI